MLFALVREYKGNFLLDNHPFGQDVRSKLWCETCKMSIRSSEKRVDVPANDSDRKNEDFPTDNDGLGAAPIVAAPRVNEPEASEHVDGGLLAWLQVAGCCFLYWNSL